MPIAWPLLKYGQLKNEKYFSTVLAFCQTATGSADNFPASPHRWRVQWRGRCCRRNGRSRDSAGGWRRSARRRYCLQAAASWRRSCERPWWRHSGQLPPRYTWRSGSPLVDARSTQRPSTPPSPHLHLHRQISLIDCQRLRLSAVAAVVFCDTDSNDVSTGQ